MICGILGFLTCGLTSLPAVLTGHFALSAIKRANGILQGSGMAIAGLVTGYIGLIFGVIFGVAFAAGLSAPLILKQRHAADRAECISHLKSTYAALKQFEVEYGALPSDAMAAKDAKFSGLTGSRVLDQLEVAGKVMETDDLLKMPRYAKGDWYYFPDAAPARTDILIISPEIGTDRIALRADGSVDVQMSPLLESHAASPGTVTIPPTKK